MLNNFLKKYQVARLDEIDANNEYVGYKIVGDERFIILQAIKTGTETIYKYVHGRGETTDFDTAWTARLTLTYVELEELFLETNIIA